MRKIFKSEAHEREFKKNGFIVVPFISGEEAAELKSRLLSFKPSDNYRGNQDTLIGKQSFHVTFFDNDAEYRRLVYQQLEMCFARAAGDLLEQYSCVQANVFMKPPGAGLVHPHQNITIVDESQFTSLSFWLPLQDTYFNNGTVCLIPGSQHHFLKYRNTYEPWRYSAFFRSEKGIDYFVPVNVKAGELLLLDDRLVHYTPVNTTGESRWVAHSIWAPSEAVLHSYEPNGEKIAVHQVEKGFWQQHVPGLRIEREPDSVLFSDERFYNEVELLALLDELKASYTKSAS